MADCKYIIDRANLHYVRKQIADYLCDLSDRLDIVEAGGGGIVADYLWSTLLTGDPTAGHIAADTTDVTTVTELRIHKLSANGNDLTALITPLRDGSFYGLFEIPDPAGTSVFRSTTTPTLVGDYFVIGVDEEPFNGQQLPAAQDNELKVHFIQSTQTIRHDELIAVTPDQHHPQSHNHDGTDGSGEVSHDDLLDITPDNHHREIHKLYGTDADGVNQHVDVDITDPLAIRDLLAIPSSGIIFKPETRMNWRGVWQPVTYYIHDVVYESGYAMVANKTTTDNAAPQPLGAPAWAMPDVPLFSSFQNTSVVYSGHFYTFNEALEFKGIRVWVPTLSADTSYRFIIITNPNSPNPTYTTIEEPVLNENDWTTLNVTSVLVGTGTELIVYIDALNSGSSTSVTGGWRFDGVSNTGNPAAQGWNANQQNTLVRIDDIDLDSVDRTTELLGIAAGSSIQFVDTLDPDRSVTYRVSVDPTQPGGAGTPIHYTVTLIDQGSLGFPAVGNATTMTADVPVAQPTDFVSVVDGWLGNQPVWGTAESFLQYDGVPQAVSANNQYGVDVLVQRLSISPDWNVLSLPSSSGGGGSFTPSVFEGAGTTGYVPDPVTENGYVLSDAGDWVYRVPEANIDGTTYGRLDGAWIPVYSQSEINDLTKWDIEHDDRNCVWGERVRFDTPENSAFMPPPDQDVTGIVKLPDLVIWNDARVQDEVVHLVPVPGTYFTFDGRDYAVDEVIDLSPSEVARISTRITGVSYALVVEALSKFDGAGTFGFVSNPDGLEEGRYLADDGTWQYISVIPSGGVRFPYTFSTDTTVTEPPVGYAKINNADPALATIISINDVNVNGNSARVFLEQIRQGDFFGMQDEASGTGFYYRATGNSVDRTTWHEIPVEIYVEDGLIANDALINVLLLGNPENRLPPGGAENEVLAKASSTDYHTYWMDVSEHLTDADIPQDGWTYGRYWNGTTYEWNTGAVDAVAFAGNVGIGTTSPQEKLHVTAGVSGAVTVIGGVDGMTIESGAGRTGGILLASPDDRPFGIFWTNSTGYRAQVRYDHSTDHMQFDTSAAERMRITSVGNVGIGTTNPLHRLQIGTNGWGANQAGLFIGAGNQTSQTDIALSSNAIIGSQDSLQFCAETGGYWAWKINANSNTSGNAGSTEVMRITSSGNVGIGNTSPVYPLVVSNAGGAGYECAPSTASGWVRHIHYNRSGAAYVSAKFEALDITFATNGASERMRIDSAGNVGIGTTNPGIYGDVEFVRPAGENVVLSMRESGTGGTDLRILSLANGGGTRYIQYTGGYMEFLLQTAGYIRWTTNGTERMRIDSAGNVGIGTTNPTELLTLSGGNIALGGTAGQPLIQAGINSIGSYSWVGNAGTGMYQPATNNVGFSTAGTERMRIDPSGNVGIGTSSPTAKLQVAGTSLLGNNAAFPLGNSNYATVSVGDRGDGLNASLVLNHSPESNAWGLHHRGSGDFDIYEWGPNTSRLNIQPGGNVGIGTNAPNSPLTVGDPVVGSAGGAGDVNISGNYHVNGIPIESFSDAPSDGQTYGRNNGNWVAVSGGGGTISNLASSPATTQVTITNTGGDNAIILSATASRAGVMTTADKSKLDGIEDNANNYDHPNFTTRSISMTGATVPSAFNSNSEGHVTSFTTRTLTPADIGAADNTNEFLPAISTPSFVGASGGTGITGSIRFVYNSDGFVIMTGRISWSGAPTGTTQIRIDTGAVNCTLSTGWGFSGSQVENQANAANGMQCSLSSGSNDIYIWGYNENGQRSATSYNDMNSGGYIDINCSYYAG